MYFPGDAENRTKFFLSHCLDYFFRLYEQGVVFSGPNVKYFRRLGYTLIAWVPSHLLYGLLLSIVLTFQHDPDERMVVAQFDITGIGTFLIAALVLVLSWVMNEAVKIEQEQALTV